MSLCELLVKIMVPMGKIGIYAVMYELYCELLVKIMVPMGEIGIYAVMYELM